MNFLNQGFFSAIRLLIFLNKTCYVTTD